jgi:Flp pilus assembly protein TadD
MSLLLDALKRAEQAKKAKAGEAAPGAGVAKPSDGAEKHAAYTGPERRELALTEHETIEPASSVTPDAPDESPAPASSFATALPTTFAAPASATGVPPLRRPSASNTTARAPRSTEGIQAIAPPPDSSVDRNNVKPAALIPKRTTPPKTASAPWMLPAVAVGIVVLGAVGWFGWQLFGPTLFNNSSVANRASPSAPTLPPASTSIGQIPASTTTANPASVAAGSTVASVIDPAQSPLPPLLPPPLADAPLPKSPAITAAITTIPGLARELTERELLAQSLKQSPASREAPVRLRLSQSIDSPKVSPELSAAYSALTRGDYAQAKKLYAQLVGVTPLNLDAQLGLAAASARSGDNALAARHYRRVLELDPRNSMAIAGLLAVSESAGIGAGASGGTKSETPGQLEAELKALIYKDPNAASLQFSLGNLYASQRHWTEAQQAFFEAYRLDADNADYLYNLAVSLDQLNQSRLALDYYQKSLAQAPKAGAQFDRSVVQRRIAELQNARSAN